MACEDDFRARSSAAQARRELRRAAFAAFAALEKLDRAAGAADDEELLLSADDVDALNEAELRDQLARLCRCVLRFCCLRVSAPAALAHAWGGHDRCTRRRLREAHAYCTYCGLQFASTAEMLSTCPGEHADDH